ncbi:MAG: CDP-alcohol phosphatidyltransferase family protein [Actinomycetia bacterium]|nr:CDP-alcohol phosphatidyltransferase family protein [Actinomycetes bacterium]
MHPIDLHGPRTGETTGRTPVLGVANAITAVRALAGAVCLGIIATGELCDRTFRGADSRLPRVVRDQTRRWWLAGIAGPALLLDAVDGAVARRTGTTSEFGARFDMEADAALFLVLSWTASRRSRSAWGIGSARYLFWLGARLRPAWGNPLEYSEIRRTVAALQGLALWIALVPATPEPVARGVLRSAFGLLAYSFGRDILTLEREPGWNQQARTEGGYGARSWLDQRR